jgi:hypothetical protein
MSFVKKPLALDYGGAYHVVHNIFGMIHDMFLMIDTLTSSAYDFFNRIPTKGPKTLNEGGCE